MDAPIQGKNINLQFKGKNMTKITIVKNALTACHTKMHVLENHSCCPLGFQNYAMMACYPMFHSNPTYVVTHWVP